MKITIKTPEELEPGDKWLGMTVEPTDAEDVPRKMVWFEGHNRGVTYNSIQTLINAGHDQVEREEPKCVTFEPFSGLVTGFDSENHSIRVGVDAQCEIALPALHLARVTVSKEPPLELVAEGVLRPCLGEMLSVDCCPQYEWINKHAKPGDTIQVRREE